MKGRTNITIDPELMETARKKFINISEITDRALREELGKVEVDTSIDKCEYCGKAEDKSYVDNKGKYHEGLSFLSPDEKWICTTCMDKKRESILK